MLAKLVLASGNSGKLRELRALFGAMVGELSSSADHGVGSVPEPHSTFVENALAKARAVSSAAELPALADDSGICVEALAGAPGVFSARYAGDAASDADNNERLLAELADKSDRRAHYHCCLVLCRSAADPAPLIAEGRWGGSIGKRPVGTGGFGYDPLFMLGDGRSAAELSAEEKNELSHRAIAVRRLLELLPESSG